MDSQAFPNKQTDAQRRAFQEVSKGKLLVIAGPCVVEGEKPLLEVAERVIGTCRDLGLPIIFKASYRKANRSRIDRITGIPLISTTRSSYPKVVPLSVTQTSSFPASLNFYPLNR
jgi:hypothetical protein